MLKQKIAFSVYNTHTYKKLCTKLTAYCFYKLQQLKIELYLLRQNKGVMLFQIDVFKKTAQIDFC